MTGCFLRELCPTAWLRLKTTDRPALTVHLLVDLWQATSCFSASVSADQDSNLIQKNHVPVRCYS